MNDSSSALFGRRGFLGGLALAGAALCTSAKASPVGTPAPAKPSTTSSSETHTLGRGPQALSVAPIGFGCMGLNYHRGEHPPKAQAIALLHEAVERGVTLFDTAEGYGPYTNEVLVGEALKGLHDRVWVTTKFGHKYVNGKRVMDEEDSTPANIRKVCEESLRRLGVETLGLFYQHRVDPKTPIEEVAGTVGELIKEGKVLNFGLCEVNKETLLRAHRVCPVAAVQSEYSLMFRTVETNGILETCRAEGIAFVPYSPLNRGFLGGLINEHTDFSENDLRKDQPRFKPEAIRANLRIVEVLNRFGRTRGMTPAQIALAWLLHKAPFIVPIPGTTKSAHLNENLGAQHFHLADEEWETLEAALAPIPVIGPRYNAEQASKVQS